MRTIIGVGNCQVRAIVQCASAALGLAPVYLQAAELGPDACRLLKFLPKADLVFAQPEPCANIVRKIVGSSDRPELPVIAAPRLYFPGFHPDLATPVKAAGKCPDLPMGTANSAILLAAWREGLEPEQALTLFRDEVYEALGYYGAYASAAEMLVQECRISGLDAQPLIDTWIRGGPFFYVPLHPKIVVINDITLHLLQNAGFDCERPAYSEDLLARNVIWPVYPEIAQRLGFAGDYVFRPNNPAGEVSGRLAPMSLDDFVQRTFAAYRNSPPNLSNFPRMGDPRFRCVRSFVDDGTDLYQALASDDWLPSEADEAMKLVCDEELLDPPDDLASQA
jgi:hypothetical protein